VVEHVVDLVINKKRERSAHSDVCDRDSEPHFSALD
jgi:hypothetical protein